MKIYTDYKNKYESTYKCDKCGRILKRSRDDIYTIYIKTIEDENPKKKWDLCEKHYRTLCRGIEKNL